MNSSQQKVGRSEGAKTRVFISYSRKDMAFANQLEAALKARHIEPSIDRSEIYAFEDWWKRIETLIAAADTVIFVLSRDAVSSDLCKKEVDFAASLNKRFAPVVAQPVPDATVPENLRRLNFIFFDDPARFEEAADRLVQALSTDIAWIREHTELGVLARRWIEAGRPHGLMLRGEELKEVETWRASRPPGAPAPTEDILALISGSRNSERVQRRQERRRNAVTTTLIIGLGVVLCMTYWYSLRFYVRDAVMWPLYQSVHFRPERWQITPQPLTADNERRLIAGNEFKECPVCPEMVVLPTGEFMMGPPDDSNNPQRRIQISQRFAVSKFEITSGNWDAYFAHKGDTSAQNGVLGRALVLVEDLIFFNNRARQPVGVSALDSSAYIAWLTEVTGKQYRLLSEAEWEYAARGGTTTAYYWGDQMLSGRAQCKDCGWTSSIGPRPAGSFPPNPFGLYDMAGNLAEWVQDDWHEWSTPVPADGSPWRGSSADGRRVIRGGMHYSPSDEIRVDARKHEWYGAHGSIGIRVARTLDAN